MSEAIRGIGGKLVAVVILPWVTPRFFRIYGDRPSELETKYLPLAEKSIWETPTQGR